MKIVVLAFIVHSAIAVALYMVISLHHRALSSQQLKQTSLMS
jgi:hypothetical protein